jgi:hypothetical protein
MDLMRMGTTNTTAGLSLAEALGKVDLQPGQTYRETVNGRTIEVRVLDDAPTPELAEQVMLEPWVDFPFTPTLTIRPTPGTLPLPDPPVIPSYEEE